MNEKATVRQVYALAAVLCERAGEEFPETREAASELIERLRIETGHPAPRLAVPPAAPATRVAAATRRREGERRSGGARARDAVTSPTT